MWTASHAANLPTEDRSSSLVNLLLQPLPPNFDSETQLLPLEPDYKTLIRVNLWSVIDGHGGGAVATYASVSCYYVMLGALLIWFQCFR